MYIIWNRLRNPLPTVLPTDTREQEAGERTIYGVQLYSQGPSSIQRQHNKLPHISSVDISSVLWQNLFGWYWKRIIIFFFFFSQNQSSKLAGSPKSEASEIMLQTSETILALVQSD